MSPWSHQYTVTSQTQNRFLIHSGQLRDILMVDIVCLSSTYLMYFLYIITCFTASLLTVYPPKHQMISRPSIDRQYPRNTCHARHRCLRPNIGPAVDKMHMIGYSRELFETLYSTSTPSQYIWTLNTPKNLDINESTLCDILYLNLVNVKPTLCDISNRNLAYIDPTVRLDVRLPTLT